MKKAVAVAVAIALILTAGAEVFAFGPGGMGGKGPGGGYNPGYNPQYPYGYQPVDPAIAAKCLAYEQTVLPLKQRLLDLKIQMLTLQSQATPDANAISAKFAEIRAVQNEILQTAINQSVVGLCRGVGRGF